MFDPRKQTPNDSWEPLNFGFQVSKKHGNCTKNDGGEGIQFRVEEMEEHEDGGIESGASSPPLWQNSPPIISPVHHSINYRSLSPSSRAQAIARGQWELMEMVKNMPESCYELSLKDLVEHPTTATPENCLINKEKNQVVQHRVKIKRQENRNMNKKKNDQIKKAKMMRSKSIDNGGLFLKMISPVPLKPKRKKKNSVNTTNKVSPKPEECENSSKSLEKDWWKKRFSSSSESGSSRTNSSRNRSSSSSSTNSRNNSNRKGKGFLSSWWSRLCFTKSIYRQDENNK